MQNHAVPLIVNIIYSLKSGGLENGLVNIINRTPPDRYRHVIICLTEADDFAKRIQSSDVQVIELHKKPGHDFDMYWRLWKLLRALKPAVVHTRNLSTLELQLLAFMCPGVKRVHGEHGRDMSDLDGSNRKYNILRKFMKRIVQQYIAVSRDLELWLERVVEVPSAKLRQIYNGVDVERFAEAGDSDLGAPPGYFHEDAIVIGTVGRLAEVKNQISLLRAFAALLKLNVDYDDKLRLLLVGDGPMREALQQESEALQLGDRVWFAGNRDDIPDFLHSMDIFTLPSLGEGVSNTILEAMATGLPIIATDVGGTPELVTDGENGLLVLVDDVQALTDGIEKLVSDKALRENMGNNSLERIRSSFNWQKTVEQYLSVYDKLLACHK